MKCPKCKATNPDGAPWCSQCLTRFDEPADSAQTEALSMIAEVGDPEVPIATSAVVRPLEGEPDRAAEATEVWTCPICDSRNQLEAERCSACGTSIYAAFGSTRDQGAALEGKNGTAAAALSVLPGVGHVYLGLTAQGIVRLLLSVWWVGSAVLLQSAPTLVQPIRMILLILGVSLAPVSAIEAYRLVQDPDAPPLLDRRVIIWGTLAAVGLLLLGGLLSIFSVPRS